MTSNFMAIPKKCLRCGKEYAPIYQTEACPHNPKNEAPGVKWSEWKDSKRPMIKCEACGKVGKDLSSLGLAAGTSQHICSECFDSESR